jgi:N-acetyltransferase 10
MVSRLLALWQSWPRLLIRYAVRHDSTTIANPQAKAILTFVEAISEKTLSSTVALTAARGRGKSAALGLAIGAALAHDYSNIFVTSPDPENLKTLFEFVFKALDALGYEEHIDYDVVQSSNPEFKKAIVRVNVFCGHRQTIQYISPEDSHVLGQAELVIIDEAAAIPLPLVRKLIGPYLVFMASTINGYEGTGRSLSIKLIQQLREQTRPTISKDENPVAGPSKVAPGGRTGGGHVRSLREIKLEEPIRYSPGDHVEKWLNNLLCLDATVISKAVQGCPHPSTCELYYVNRDTLFSYHPASEVFLQRMMALYVASHYKNSPNDLQMLSDAPAHHLFVLLPPIKEDDNNLPDPLVVVQVALEGNISRDQVLKELSQFGSKSAGDMIPWIISQQVSSLRERGNNKLTLVVPRQRLCLPVRCPSCPYSHPPRLRPSKLTYPVPTTSLTVRWATVLEPLNLSTHSTAASFTTLTMPQQISENHSPMPPRLLLYVNAIYRRTVLIV